MTTVLVVDDEPQIRRALATNLRAREFDVVLADNGRAALQLAAGDDVKTATLARKKLQNCQRRVGFHGVADMQFATSKPTLVGFQGFLHGCLRIDKQRRSMLLRQCLQAGAFHPQRPVAVMNMGVAWHSGISHGGTEAEKGAATGAAGTEEAGEERAGADSAGMGAGTGAGAAG